MQLTTAQKTALKAHMAANTNPATLPGGGTFAVNTRLATGSPDDEQAIASWYNGAALAGDAQPFSNLFVWSANVTVAQLNAAVKWQTAPAGSTPADVTNSWLLWQTMLWNMQIDLSDGQVRKGVLQVWGDVAGGSAAAIAAPGVGQLAGRRVELALSPAAAGAATSAWGAAHVCPANVLGQTLTQPDVHDLLLNG